MTNPPFCAIIESKLRNKMIDREEDFNVMRSDREVFQCSSCGNIHKVDWKYKPIGDDIYVTLWCERCKGQTQQLYCGDDESDLYSLYDLNVDPRYY